MTIPSDRKLRENIQKNLIFYRKKRKVTQRQLADILKIGVSTVSGWERGAYTPDIDTLFIICNYLQVDLYDMCGISAENVLMSDGQNDLLKIYNILNEDGKRKLLERAEELRDLGYVKRADEAKMA